MTLAILNVLSAFLATAVARNVPFVVNKAVPRFQTTPLSTRGGSIAAAEPEGVTLHGTVGAESLYLPELLDVSILRTKKV